MPRSKLKPTTTRSGSSPSGVGVDLAAGVLPLSSVAGATWWLFGLPASYLAQVGALYLVLAGLVALGVSPGARSTGFGMANRITLWRSTLVLPVAGLTLHSDIASESAFWWIIFWSGGAMSLDGLDGRIARQTGTTSAFGARFDMELDAFLILVLSLLVWQSGKVGAWVLLVGGIRYLFVAAGRVWPTLAGPLPESQRRKTVCVVQGLVLLLCLGPVIPPGVATFAVAAALGLLVYSFGVDVTWLAREGRRRSRA